MEKATFAAGCFWQVEVAFRQVSGVSDVAVGYSGGSVESPSYEDVCTGRTGHAEVVQVEFDPERVSYEDLLEVFWRVHDPTTRNRQGFDIGTQYRSAIFFHSPKQQAAARASKERRQESLDEQGGAGLLQRRKQIVTEITPASEFYRAEDYHQRYLEKRGQASCPI